MAKIAVKHPEPPAKEVPTEVLAASIVAISQGVRRLRSGSLNDRALVLLIQDAVGGVGPERGPKKQLTQREIKAVLDGIQDLEKTFVRRQPVR
jgi:hypothetical protein